MPETIREEVNRRLKEWQTAQEIADWLNTLPEVRLVLDTFFEGRPVLLGNVCYWHRENLSGRGNNPPGVKRLRKLARRAHELAVENGESLSETAVAIATGQILELLEAADGKMALKDLGALVGSIAKMRLSEVAQQRADTDSERLKRKDEEIALAHKRFEQELKEYSDKVNARKNEIESALMMTEDGGLTPEALRRIEEAAKLL